MPKVRYDARTGVPYITTTVRIYGERQIRAFQVMAIDQARQPWQLAADIVLDGIRSGLRDPRIARTVALLPPLGRQPAPRLRLVKGAGR